METEPPERKTAGNALIVAAHPDDETIGAGVWMLRRQPELLTIVHATDGSPRNLLPAGYSSCAEYAQARRRELWSAVGLAGIRPDQCLELGFADQEAYLHLAELSERILALLTRLRPDTVLTHPYEGGHPDHDALAFAVAEAVGRLDGRRPAHHEFTSYHAGSDGMITGRFLPAAGTDETALEMNEQERELKSAMLDSFVSQRHVIQLFPVGTEERFRTAPAYDFTEAPHPGELQYEKFGWGITGAAWRKCAVEALACRSERALI